MALCLANPDEITVIAVKSAIYWYMGIINDTFYLEKSDDYRKIKCCVGRVVYVVRLST